MQIIIKQISEITPYEKNPRKNDNAVNLVMKSIEAFGFKVPIVIDKDGIIVTGHTRYKAAKKIGLKEVPCIMADDLTEEQIKAYRLADNKVAEFAEWDIDMLTGELNNILDFDMTEFGFNENSSQNQNQNLVLQKVELEPYVKVHYLISLNTNLNDQVIELIKEIEKIEGVEIDSSLN